MTLRVERAGLAVVTDLGRPGLGGLGVAVGGAADRHAAVLASTLVGNAPTDPLVEATGSALTLTTDAELLLAVTGAAEEVRVDGHRQPSHAPLVVPAGARVELPAPRTGWRSYLAVHGGFAAEQVLGSVAPDTQLGCGRRLGPGDALTTVLDVAPWRHPHLDHPVLRPGAVGSRPTATVDVTDGPEAGEFDDALAGAWLVGERSDHVGLRLAGPAPERDPSGAEVLSRGVPVGAVEVPPGGGLLVLLRGRLVTAGYPVVAVATTTALDRLGQVRPGDRLVFRRRSLAEAHADLARREATLHAVAVRVAAALTAAGRPDLVRPGHPSGAAAP